MSSVCSAVFVTHAHDLFTIIEELVIIVDDSNLINGLEEEDRP